MKLPNAKPPLGHHDRHEESLRWPDNPRFWGRLGAASVMYYGIKNWQIGGVFQNPVSFAGGDGTSDVNQLVVQPVINYLMGPWYLGAGDFSAVFDWKNGGATSIVIAQSARE